MIDERKEATEVQAQPAAAKPLSVREAAEVMDVCRATVYKLIRENKLKCRKITPRLFKIEPAEISKFLESVSA
jgi:excisionase family DNA binding protein